MTAVEWKSRQRNYLQEARIHAVRSEEVANHPLQGLTITVVDRKDPRDKKESKGGSSDGIRDPLSALKRDDPLSAFEGGDPLSQFATEIDPLSLSSSAAAKSEKKSVKGESELDDSFEPWSLKRSGILSKFTTSEKLTMVMVLMTNSEKTEIGSKAAVTMTDKVRNRLDQLDDMEEGSVQETLNLSQQDYIRRIEEFNGSLIEAWNHDQKVKSLKIVIQCAKLLADVSVIQFYPSKFVLISDILDTFGKLVFDRILSKSMSETQRASRPLSEDFTPDQIPESAKETCRNWFYKIASIRELIPRLYVEAAILKCYKFLASGEYDKALVRLADMCRGIGDPLVALYARCYLCRVGISISPKFREHLMPCFEDFLQMYGQIETDSVQNILAAQKLELSRYLVICSPALDWILQCVAHRGSQTVLDSVLGKCQARCNRALLLNSIMLSFRPEFISGRAAEFANLIRDCEEVGFPKHLMYRSLGTCVVSANPPEDQRLALLNDVWKAVTKLASPSDYIACAEVWIEFVLKFFGKRELNTLLGDIIKHMTPDRAYEDHYPSLQGIISKILFYKTDLVELFAVEKFMAFIDMFQKESVKVEACRTIMESYASSSSGSTTSDLVLIHTLRFLCQTMHDSVNALSLDDEVRALGALISAFISTVSFGRDLEQQLNFYVECRAAFCNIDPVLVSLVHSVNGLAVQTKRIVGRGGGHTRKTAAFVRACMAYAYITVPSLNGVFHRLHLYLASGQVALMNQCLSQADAFFKAAILLIKDVPRYIEIEGKVRSTEPMLVDFINNFISTLLVVPDSPDQGVLYLTRGLLNTVQDYEWDRHGDSKAIVFANMLVGLSAMGQDFLPYHVDRVESNDTLYGSDPKFLAEVSEICSTLLREVSAHLKALDQPETAKRHACLCVEIFQRIAGHGDVNDGVLRSLATKLWSMAIRTTAVDSKLIRRNIEYVRSRSKGQRSDGKGFSELLGQMSPHPA